MKQTNNLRSFTFGFTGSRKQRTPSVRSRPGVFGLCPLILLSAALATAQTNVAVSPVTNSMLLGDSLTLNVVVNNVTSLHAVQTVLTFDNAVIQAYAVANGPFLATSGENVFFSANPPPGPSVNSIAVDQAILGYATASGSGVLFVVKFRAVGSGTSQVAMPSVDLRDLTNNHIPATVSPGSISVNLIASATSLTSAPNPSTFGQGVTLTATLTPGGATGTVTFYDGTTSLGTGTVSGGTATLNVATLAVGTHADMTAAYGGDGSYSGSTSPAYSHVVNQASSTTSLTSAPNPSIFGQNVILTATVVPGGATGTVTFYDGTTSLGTGPVSGGTATLNVAVLTVGTHSGMTASYGGDGSYSGSTSTAHSHTVNQASSTTSLTSAPNPSTFGQNVILTATVLPGGATGTVTFYDGATSLGIGTVSGGTATLNISTLTVGTHPSMTAAYNGDASYSGSTSVIYSHTVVAGIVTVQYHMTNSWNLLSLPLTVEDSSKAGVFPSAISSAFAFDRATGYVRRDTLDHGIGYWLKFPSAQDVGITGTLRGEDTIAVHSGWNMIGSISYPADTSSIIQIPSGIVVSRYFEFAGTYVPADTLQPAKGYWVKTSQDGRIVLHTDLSRQNHEVSSLRKEKR